MTDTIIVAIISFVGTLIGSLAAQSKTTALVSYRLEQLEHKVNKHNEVIERTYKLEKQCEILKEDYEHMEEDMHKLEHYRERE